MLISLSPFEKKYIELTEEDRAIIVNCFKSWRFNDYQTEYKDIPEEYKKLFESETLKLNFILDFRRMISLMKFKEFDEIVSEYDTIIFEGAQGLALDEDNVD